MFSKHRFDLVTHQVIYITCGLSICKGCTQTLDGIVSAEVVHVVPVLVLLFVALWFILRGDLFCILRTLCHFVLVFFSPFSIAITSFGEERANLSAFRTYKSDDLGLFDLCLFGFVGFLFLLVSGQVCGL